nr:putative uncharacterized protein C5orf66 homolog isoform X1 [Macaca nemestrina]
MEPGNLQPPGQWQLLLLTPGGPGAYAWGHNGVVRKEEDGRKGEHWTVDRDAKERYQSQDYGADSGGSTWGTFSDLGQHHWLSGRCPVRKRNELSVPGRCDSSLGHSKTLWPISWPLKHPEEACQSVRRQLLNFHAPQIPQLSNGGTAITICRCFRITRAESTVIDPPEPVGVLVSKALGQSAYFSWSSSHEAPAARWRGFQRCKEATA